MSRWLWVKFVVSVGLLWLLLQHVGATGVLARIGAVNPGLAALAIIVLLFQLWLGAFRWHSVTRAFEVPTPAFVLWRHLLVAQFCSQLLRQVWAVT